MINFTSRSFIPAAQSVTKVAPGTDAPADTSKAATAAPPASAGAAKSNANQSFQSLLNAQADGGGAAQAQNPLLPEVPAQLGGDEDTVEQVAPGGRGRTSAKSDAPAATAPATVDLASLIGAATGQAVLPPVSVAVPRPADATVATTGVATAKTGVATTLAAGVATTSTTDADLPPDRAADDEKFADSLAKAPTGESGTKPQAAADPKAVAGTQQMVRDAETAPIAAVPQPRLEQLDSANATQNAVLPHVAMPAIADVRAPSAPAVAPAISTPVGAEGWDQALGQRVVWLVAQRNPTAEIHVNPPNLGPVSVTVNVDNNTASATFVAAHAATRDAINDAMPRLKEMLAGSGIALGQFTVSAESSSHGGGAHAQQAYVPRGNDVAAAAASGAGAPLVSAVTTVSAPQGLVDTFA